MRMLIVMTIIMSENNYPASCTSPSCDDDDDNNDYSVENNVNDNDKDNDNPSQCKSFDGSVHQRTKSPWNGWGQEHSGGEFVLTIIRWFGKFGSRFS